ncbi:hypothetical protein P4O66_011258, partial [Electrophorus voltai]
PIWMLFLIPDFPPSPKRRAMSSTRLAETEEDVFGESRLRDSLSSMEGEDSLDGKSISGAVPTSCAPLHASFGRSSPSPDLCLSSSPARRDRGLAPDLCPLTPEMRAEEQGPGMHRHLLSTSSQEQGTGRLSTSSQEALLPAASGFSGRPCSRSENSSPAHLRQGNRVRLHEGDPSLPHQTDHSQSEDDSHDFGSDEPGSPTVLLDKKTRRSFLNLGVTLRRTYGKVRKDRSNRLSAGNRETERTEARSSRSSGPPFVPFSWFSDRLRSSSSPKTSKILSEGSSQEEESEPSASLLEVPGRPGRPERSQPYRSLGDPRAEEGCGGAGPALPQKKVILPFSTSGRDRGERQNGVHRNRDGGHKEDGQKLLTT